MKEILFVLIVFLIFSEGTIFQDFDDQYCNSFLNFLVNNANLKNLLESELIENINSTKKCESETINEKFQWIHNKSLIFQSSTPECFDKNGSLVIRKCNTYGWDRNVTDCKTLKEVNSKVSSIMTKNYDLKSNGTTYKIWFPKPLIYLVFYIKNIYNLFNENSKSMTEFIYIDKNLKTKRIKVERCRRQELVLNSACPSKAFSFIFAPEKCYGTNISKGKTINLKEFAEISQWINKAHLKFMTDNKTRLGGDEKHTFYVNFQNERHSLSFEQYSEKVKPLRLFEMKRQRISMNLTLTSDNRTLQLDCMNCDLLINGKNGVHCFSKIDGLEPSEIKLLEPKAKSKSNLVFYFNYNENQIYWCEGVSIFGFEIVKSFIFPFLNSTIDEKIINTAVVLKSHHQYFLCNIQFPKDFLATNISNELYETLSIHDISKVIDNKEEDIDTKSIDALANILTKIPEGEEKNKTNLYDLINVSKSLYLLYLDIFQFKYIYKIKFKKQTIRVSLFPEFVLIIRKLLKC